MEQVLVPVFVDEVKEIVNRYNAIFNHTRSLPQHLCHTGEFMGDYIEVLVTFDVTIEIA